MKRRGLITLLIAVVVVFAGLAVYADLPDLLDHVSSIPTEYWLMALALALANYVLRLVRWHYYLALLGIRIGIGASTAIFLAGLTMVLSPGRVGELAKSYFLKEKLDVPVSVSAPAVIAERVIDLVCVLVLSLWGLSLVPYGWVAGIVVAAAFGLFLLLGVTRWGSGRVLRLPVPGRWRPFMTESRDSFRRIFSPGPLTVALLLGLAACFADGCALWLLLEALDADVSLGQAVSIYAASTLLGAITMLPGGLVGTEGGMVTLLQQLDLTRAAASSATLVVRICTLWFAVVLGVLGLAYVQWRMSPAPAGMRDAGPTPATPMPEPGAGSDGP